MRDLNRWMSSLALSLCLQSADADSSLLGCFDLSAKPALSIQLPKGLREVSGLAYTPDGKLLAHNDETSTVFELDPNTGKITRFLTQNGSKSIGDYEGITVTGRNVLLVTSSGMFLRGNYPLDRIPMQRWRSDLGERCEIEGLTYNSTENALVLACKLSHNPRGPAEIHLLRSYLATHAHPQDELRGTLEELTDPDVQRVNGTGITYHPASDRYLVLSSKDPAIVEVSASGDVLGVAALKGKRHQQPEGIALAPDGRLFIADEGGRKAGRLRTYRPQSACTIAWEPLP